MRSSTPPQDKPIVLSQGKPFDDPDYEHLLRDFRRCHPAEFDRWVAVERRSFEERRGLGGYHDQGLMKFVQTFIADRTVDEYGGLGASIAFRVLRGHILRSLLAEVPDLNPAPGKILITEPLSHTDEEQKRLATEFGSAFPRTWEDWIGVESGADDWPDPLLPISGLFYQFLRERCWVQTHTALGAAFSRMRSFIQSDLQRS